MKGLSVILTLLLFVVASQLPRFVKKAPASPEKTVPANLAASQSNRVDSMFATFAKDPQQKFN
jgi:hypothetical protein